MGSSMDCKQQYCCGSRHNCTGPEDPPAMQPQPKAIELPDEARKRITFDYNNHRGLDGKRNATPIKIWFGKTAWYEGEQWFMTAFDHDRDALRDFSLSRISNISTN